MSLCADLKDYCESVAFLSEELEQMREFVDFFESTKETEQLLISCLCGKDLVHGLAESAKSYKEAYMGLVKSEIIGLYSKEDQRLLNDNAGSRQVRVIRDALFRLQGLAEKSKVLSKL